MKVTRFEDLICWQKARVLTNAVYAVSRENPFAKDWDLSRQIRDAATSAMSNIAEGFDRWSRKELARFLDIAKGSAGEVRSELYVALDQQYISQQQFNELAWMAIETSKTIGGLIGYLAGAQEKYAVRETISDGHNALDLPDEFCNPPQDC